mmetsp:Transcript_24550/g.48167  ORF Transcript_24550/g.48167 Transcript_24550/m.48167 type:complete len:82 (+) Transcript_24550:1230-1475(+)
MTCMDRGEAGKGREKKFPHRVGSLQLNGDENSGRKKKETGAAWWWRRKNKREDLGAHHPREGLIQPAGFGFGSYRKGLCSG